MLDANDEAPIIRWVNSLMFQAAKDRASDIHIEPGEKDVVVRYRVDGVLREAKRAPKKFQPSIIARVKIMAGLNIAEKRLPQDGRIRRKMAGKDVDMRVATVPTAARRERHDPSARSQLGAARPRRHRLRERSARADPRHHQAAARHLARHRPDRLRQDDHAVRVPVRDQLARHQHPHRRGSGRVPARGHLADPGQLEDRSDVRVRAALVLAPRPRRHHGRRNSRSRDRRDRDHRVAHRSPRVLDRPHQRRRRRHHAPRRHGHRAVPRRVVARRPARAAPRAPAVLRVRAPGAAVRGDPRASSALDPRHVLRGWLPASRRSRACARRRSARCSSRSAARRAASSAIAAVPASTSC